ncbi:MAG: hypothetical protein HOD98_07745 [Candidatus Marinimicrobia bacterium]|nr:hypothetical protein [Candidatus Neomarinimicrobiota bacterium]
MRKFLPIILLLFSSCFLFEDDKDEQNTTLTLSLSSATVTTISLQVEPEDTTATFSYNLVRNDSTILNSSYPVQTDIVDSGLIANSIYNYQIHWLNGDEIQSFSNVLSVQTQDSTIQLSVVDIAKTNVTLQITIPDTNLNWTTELYRNDSLVLTETSDSNTMSLRDWGLYPSTEYTYKAKRLEGSTPVSTSIPVSISTEETSMTLTAIDTGVTSSMLHIQREGTLPWTAHIQQNGTIVDTLTLNTNDTMYRHGGMEPGTENFIAFLEINNKNILDNSHSLELSTMDTTFYIFEFEEPYEFGLHASNVYDAHIVDEDNIIIVGSFHLPDTTSSTGTTYYNYGVWDGISWEFEIANNQETIKSIYYINENDIWVLSGGIPMHWDGNEWTPYLLWEMGVTEGGVSLQEIWGSSSSNIFFVGSDGVIVHWDGNKFTAIESVVPTMLDHIEGSDDGEHVFAIGADFLGDYSGTGYILEYKNGEWEIIYYWNMVDGTNAGEYGEPQTVEVFLDTAYFTMANGLWKYNFISGESIFINEYLHENEVLVNYFGQIKIIDKNDMYFFAGRADFVHFNGISFYKDNTNYNSRFHTARAAKINGNTIFLGGWAWPLITAFSIRGTIINTLGD